MNRRNHIKIEGYSPDEIASFSIKELRSLIFCDEPITFQAGSGEILGQFKIKGESLIIELAHIDGGGEGVLPTIAALAKKLAKREGFAFIDWRVHAINCEKPNFKLQNVLEKKGFIIEKVSDSGECYHLIEQLETSK